MHRQVEEIIAIAVFKSGNVREYVSIRAGTVGDLDQKIRDLQEQKKLPASVNILNPKLVYSSVDERLGPVETE